MRKIAIVCLTAVISFGTLNTNAAVMEGEGRGGVMGFIAGCCFGPRAMLDYNDGKEIHWREWCRIIPYVGFVFGIWDGVEGAGGTTRAEFVEKYGSTFY